MIKTILLAGLLALLPCAAQAQWPPTGTPDTKPWEDWNKARPVVPAPPVLIAPANGATNVPINSIIQVQSIGAQRLEWRYGTSSNPPIISEQGFSFKPTNEKYNTKYYLRVRGINPTGATALITWSYTTGPIPMPPTLTCPQAITVTTNTTAPTPVLWPAPTTTGGQQPLTGPTCMPATGDLFPNGTSSVSCRVQDAAMQSAMCTFPVTVTYVPPAPVESPVGWRVPRDGPSVTTDIKAVWTFGADNQCGAGFPHPDWCRQMFNNGIQVASSFGFEYEWNADPLVTGSPKEIYVRGDDSFWYRLYSPLNCQQGQPCQPTWIYYDERAPSEIMGSLPPPCRDGIDNDGDGKIDFNPPAGFQKDPACQNPDWPTETDQPAGPLAAANHDGVQLSYVYQGQTYTLPLVFRLYVDGWLVKEQPRSEVWNGGQVVMALPTLSTGTHVVQMSAVNVCAPGTPGCGKSMESTQSLPPAEITVP